MNLDVQVGARARTWRLLQAESYLRWLGEKPWAARGGVLGLRIPRHLQQSVLDALRDAVPAIERDGPIWEAIDARDGQLQAALRRWLVSSVASVRELVSEMASLCNATPRLLVVNVAKQSLSSCLNEARQLVDVAQKIPERCALSFLLLSDEAGESTASMCGAWPEVSTRSNSEDLLWSEYLHERVAWHAGGDLEIVCEVAEELGEPRLHDEVSLERILEADAVRRWGAIDNQIRSALASRLDVLGNHLQLRHSEFAPGASRRQRPVPWLAHALLRVVPQHVAWRQLRAAYACQTLSMRVLGRCIDLEARVCDGLQVALATATPPDGVQGHFDCYSLEHRFSLVPLMPPNAPRPRDLWDVAGFGAVIMHSAASSRAKLHRLRALRNHLAHGGPAGWRALLEIEALERELG